MNNKLTLLDEYNLFFDGKEEDLQRISDSNIFVLNKWISFNKNNVGICHFINKVMSHVPVDVLKWILFHSIDKKKNTSNT